MNILSEDDSRLVNATETIMSVAHCLRELIENSLDAKSTIINISLIKLGLESIKISDNGCGISREGLELLCTEGATSKILGSGSNGGRGKALEAISSLSNISVESYCEKDQCGYRLYFSEKRERKIERCVRSRGTSINVESLFYNVPVRRRYWIGNKSRLQTQIREVCAAFALSTTVNLTVTNDKSPIVQVSNPKLPQRVRCILDSKVSQGLINGKSDLNSWLPNSKIEYFTSSPTTNSKGKIFLSINGRPAANDSICGALRQEFRLCAGPKSPTIILHITTERKNFDFLPNDPIIAVSFRDEARLQQELRSILSSVWQKTSETLTFDDVNSGDSSFDFPSSQNSNKRSRLKFKPNLSAQVINSRHVCDLSSQKIIDRLHKTSIYARDFGPSNNVITTDSFDEMEIIGQWNKSFLVTRLGSDVYAIDQHAACEAQNFEKLRKQSTKKKQVLLNPLVVKVSPEDLQTAETHKEELQKFGFDFVVKGDEIHLTAVPSDKNVVNDSNDFLELIALVNEAPNSTPMTHNARIQLAYHACHSSVRVGDAMNNTQIKRLLSRMAHSDYPWNCPHGRPTWCCIKVLDNNSDLNTNATDQSSLHSFENDQSSIHSFENDQSSIHSFENDQSSLHSFENDQCSPHCFEENESIIHPLEDGRSSPHRIEDEFEQDSKINHELLV